ncbi:MAG: DMT family transporter, partial [Alphaproteobacteria bacterium]|nr:DMT family transporter [Alphaproteobacteria bacterium]
MARFEMPALTREEVRRGILYVVASVFVFALANAIVKWLVARYSVIEIVVFRSSFALLPCLFLVMRKGGIAILRTRRLRDHATRSVLQFVSMICIFTSFSLMPLADSVAITFSSPLFLTMLSIPLLGEQVGIHRWSAVVLGFIGVLVILPPGAGMLHAGALLALANALINASVTIAIRRMTLTEASTALAFYQQVCTGLLGLLFLPFVWRSPNLFDLALFLAAGLLSGVGQFWWTEGCRFTPAAVAAPFSYTAMVWALILGYLLWGDLPTSAVLIGAAIVIASGLY